MEKQTVTATEDLSEELSEMLSKLVKDSLVPKDLVPCVSNQYYAQFYTPPGALGKPQGTTAAD